VNWFKKIRESKGYTQEQLATVIGVDRSLISKIENGSARPSPEKAKKFAELLGFKWTRFFEPNQEAS
jgi:transcriptional regulator with XRE-family HTH domain